MHLAALTRKNTKPIVAEWESVNPINDETVKRLDELTDRQLDKAIERADSCYKEWKKKSYAEQAKIVTK